MLERAAYMGMKRASSLLRLSLLAVLGCADEPAQLTVGYVPRGRDAAAASEDDAQSVPSDAGETQEAAAPCRLPEGVSLPEDLSAEVQGDPLAPVVYYAGGARLPGGRYRVSYLQGCFSCCVTLLDEFWLVGANVLTMIMRLPGGSDMGLDVAPVASCPVRGAPYPDVDFDFEGGKLGIWFTDAVALDNVDGDGAGGPNPTWRLTLLECR